MSGKSEKIAVMRAGGQKAKAAAAKLYALAQDPATQAKAAKLLEDGKKVYRAATSPEAKEAYRKAAQVVNKMRKK